MLDDLFEFLQGAVTPYHAAAIAAAWLDAAGYTRLEEEIGRASCRERV